MAQALIRKVPERRKIMQTGSRLRFSLSSQTGLLILLWKRRERLPLLAIKP
jgi:hypothetical protein